MAVPSVARGGRGGSGDAGFAFAILQRQTPFCAVRKLLAPLGSFHVCRVVDLAALLVEFAQEGGDLVLVERGRSVAAKRFFEKSVLSREAPWNLVCAAPDRMRGCEKGIVEPTCGTACN